MRSRGRRDGLEIALVIAVASHLVAIAWVDARERPKRETPRPVAAMSTTTPAEPVPIAVVLLDGDTVSSARAATGAAPHAVAVAAAAPGAPVPHGVAETPRGRSMLAMRGSGSSRDGANEAPAGSARPPQLNGGLSASFMNDFLSREVHAVEPPPPTGDLEPNGRGTLRTTKEPMQPFDATVARDGTVTIKDRPSVGDFHIPRWNVGGLRIPLPLIVGRMSFDDAIMHAKHIDPYSSAKLRFLDRTRDERVAIGNEYRKQQLAQSAELMRDNLARLWQRTLDPRARKQLVFALWDECAETGERAIVDGGAAARAYLVGFVRSHLPAGSADAFTADELAALNARRQSAQAFDPYAVDAP